MMERYCRICDIRAQMTGNVAEYAARYIEELQEEDRTSEEEYAERLETCLACGRRLDAMCTACGCFVEIRAAVKKQECPYHLWDVRNCR